MMACWWLDHLDEVIAQIRAVDSAEVAHQLMDRYCVSEVQATAILDIGALVLTASLVRFAARKKPCDLPATRMVTRPGRGLTGRLLLEHRRWSGCAICGGGAGGLVW